MEPLAQHAHRAITVTEDGVVDLDFVVPDIHILIERTLGRLNLGVDPHSGQPFSHVRILLDQHAKAKVEAVVVDRRVGYQQALFIVVQVWVVNWVDIHMGLHDRRALVGRAAEASHVDAASIRTHELGIGVAFGFVAELGGAAAPTRVHVGEVCDVCHVVHQLSGMGVDRHLAHMPVGPLVGKHVVDPGHALFFDRWPAFLVVPDEQHFVLFHRVPALDYRFVRNALGVGYVVADPVRSPTPEVERTADGVPLHTATAQVGSHVWAVGVQDMDFVIGASIGDLFSAEVVEALGLVREVAGQSKAVPASCVPVRQGVCHDDMRLPDRLVHGALLNARVHARVGVPYFGREAVLRPERSAATGNQLCQRQRE